MKTLLLLRHASAGNDPPGGGDRERRLEPSGVIEATQVAKLLEAQSLQPTLVLCSSAERTVETLQQLRPALPAAAQLEVEDDLYLAGGEQLLRAIAEADDAHDTLLVVAHNPGIAELANLLANGGDQAARARMGRGFPAASLARLELASDHWAELRPQSARLVDFSSPRDL